MSFIDNRPSLLSPASDGSPLSAQDLSSTIDSKDSYQKHDGYPFTKDHLRDPSETLSAPPYLSISPFIQSSDNSDQSSIWPGPDGSLYLTPPQGSSLDERPPYRSRSPSAESLNMMRRRASTMPHESNERTRLKSRRVVRRRKANWDDDADMPLGWLPSGTSKDGPKFSGSRPPSNSRKQRRMKRSILKYLKSQRANPMQDTDTALTTRSNSFKSSDVFYDCNSTQSTGASRRGTLQNDSHHADLAVVANQVVQFMRDRLTYCKISHRDQISAPSTPATITLRRASARPQNGKSPSVNFPKTFNDSHFDLSARPNQSVGGTIAYVITDDDLDYVAELINSTFEAHDNHGKHITASRTTSNGALKGADVEDLRRASVLDNHIIPSPTIWPTTAITSINARYTPRSDLVPSAVGQILPQDSGHDFPHHDLQHQAKDSVYEIIWKDDRDGQSSSESQGECPPRSDEDKVIMKEKANPVEMTSDCEEDKPADISHTIPAFKMDWSKSDSFTHLPRSDRSTAQNPILSMTQQKPKVVSFPPLLDRPSTNEWIIPVADIMSLDVSQEQSLYAQGIDAHTGPILPREAASVPTPIIEVDEWQEQVFDDGLQDEDSPIGPTDSDNAIDNTKRSNKRKVLVRSPASLHRTGESFQLGSAIGISAGKRRKSSTRPPDLWDDDDETSRGRKRTWYKPRKDSGWPMRRASSVQLDSPERRDSELSSRRPSKGRRISEATSQGVSEARKGSVARYNLIERLIPRLPSIDRVGIYQSMTGSETPQHDEHSFRKVKQSNGTMERDEHTPSIDWIG